MSRGVRCVLMLLLLASGRAASAQEQPDTETLEARERAALLDVRTVLMAERLLAARNGGFFGEFACLTQPETCLPGFSPQEASFLDPTHDWLAERLGYSRSFHPGPKASEEESSVAKAASGSLKSFAFTVTPITPGRTGLRAFCGDSTGKVCFTPDGSGPPVERGRCGRGCKELK